MKKYRILLVIRHPVGGIRTFCRYVYRSIDYRRYQFTIVSPDVSEIRVLLKDLEALDLSYIAADRRSSNAQLFRIATEIIRNGDFDLIHSHGFTSAACSIAGALWKRTPHILTCHDVFTQGQFVGLKGVVRKAFLGILLSTIDCIHCVSHDARDNMLAYLPILRLFRRKVIAIPNGIEVQQFLGAKKRDLRQELGLPPESFLIGFMGRFMSQKGFRYLIDALAGIAGRHDIRKRAVVLTFGEDGFIREERQKVQEKGLGELVYFLPFVEDVAPTLKGLDVIAIPSLWEACPLLAMEAMVAGVPVIGTNCVGLREVLRDSPAKVVPASDSMALSDALVAEMRNPTIDKAQEFASEAAVRFQVKARAAEIEQLMLKFLRS